MSDSKTTSSNKTKVKTKSTKVKCSICKKEFDRKLITKRGNRNYCPSCVKVMDQRNKDWDLLFQYICEIYECARPNGMMFKQIQSYKENEPYNYTYIGIYYTMKYFYEILEKDVNIEMGLSFVPYYYDKAKKYYNKLYDIMDTVEDFECNEKIQIIKTQIHNKVKKSKEIPLKGLTEVTYEENNKDSN